MIFPKGESGNGMWVPMWGAKICYNSYFFFIFIADFKFQYGYIKKEHNFPTKTAFNFLVTEIFLGKWLLVDDISVKIFWKEAVYLKEVQKKWTQWVCAHYKL